MSKVLVNTNNNLNNNNQNQNNNQVLMVIPLGQRES